MLKRCIAAENRKLHRSPIWLLFFVMPLISASYGTFNYLQNLEILHRALVQLVDPAHAVLLDAVLPCHGGGLCGLPVAAGAYGPQLEFDYGRPRAAAGSVFGQVLRGCCKLALLHPSAGELILYLLPAASGLPSFPIGRRWN